MSKVAGEGVGQLGGSVSAESRRVTNSSWNSSLPFIHDAKSRLTVSLSQDEQASLTLRPLLHLTPDTFGPGTRLHLDFSILR